MPSRQIPSRKLGGDKSAFQSEFHIICFFFLMEQKIRAFLDGLERRSHHHHQFSEIRVQPVFGMDVSVMDWSVDASFSKSPAFSLSLFHTHLLLRLFPPLSPALLGTAAAGLKRCCCSLSLSPTLSPRYCNIFPQPRNSIAEL